MLSQNDTRCRCTSIRSASISQPTGTLRWRRLRRELVTLAHQDDHFAPFYVARLSSALRRHPGALIGFCDYSEHTPLGPRPTNINLWIKRALRAAGLWRARVHHRSPRQGALAVTRQSDLLSQRHVRIGRRLPISVFPADFRPTWIGWRGWSWRAGPADSFTCANVWYRRASMPGARLRRRLRIVRGNGKIGLYSILSGRVRLPPHWRPSTGWAIAPIASREPRRPS